MVLTVEPGCYFMESELLPAFESDKFKHFLVEEKLRPLIGSGGVRLEDNILVTEDGFENFSSGPKTVEEVEALMAEGK